MPTKCTPETIEKILEAIRGGAYLETAAAYAGIRNQTLHNWIRKGRRDLAPHSKEAKPKPNTREAKFVRQLDKAMALAELMDLATISHFAQGHEVEKTTVTKTVNAEGKTVEEKTAKETRQRREWQAAAWRLERKFPERYGRRLAVSGEAGAGGGFQLNLVTMPARDKPPEPPTQDPQDNGNER